MENLQKGPKNLQPTMNGRPADILLEDVQAFHTSRSVKYPTALDRYLLGAVS